MADSDWEDLPEESGKLGAWLKTHSPEWLKNAAAASTAVRGALLKGASLGYANPDKIVPGYSEAEKQYPTAAKVARAAGSAVPVGVAGGIGVLPAVSGTLSSGVLAGATGAAQGFLENPASESNPDMLNLPQRLESAKTGGLWGAGLGIGIPLALKAGNGLASRGKELAQDINTVASGGEKVNKAKELFQKAYKARDEKVIGPQVEKLKSLYAGKTVEFSPSDIDALKSAGLGDEAVFLEKELARQGAPAPSVPPKKLFEPETQIAPGTIVEEAGLPLKATQFDDFNESFLEPLGRTEAPFSIVDTPTSQAGYFPGGSQLMLPLQNPGIPEVTNPRIPAERAWEISKAAGKASKFKPRIFTDAAAEASAAKQAQAANDVRAAFRARIGAKGGFSEAEDPMKAMEKAFTEIEALGPKSRVMAKPATTLMTSSAEKRAALEKLAEQSGVPVDKVAEKWQKAARISNPLERASGISVTRPLDAAKRAADIAQFVGAKASQYVSLPSGEKVPVALYNFLRGVSSSSDPNNTDDWEDIK